VEVFNLMMQIHQFEIITLDIRLIIAPGTLIASTLILGAVRLISGMVPAFRASRRDESF
jgi:ABC-type antimicrobial peptide transport system permease subunit